MDYEALERVLGHTFQDKALLETALTHTSFANEARHGTKHNERLEFLGDSVLSIVVAEYLFTHSSLPEGDLTRMRGRAVHLCPENRPGPLAAAGPRRRDGRRAHAAQCGIRRV